MGKVKVVGVAAVPVTLIGGLWMLAGAGVSSEQRVADAEPPPPAVAEAVLEERLLQDSVVVRGRVDVLHESPIFGPPAAADGVPMLVELPIEVGETVSSGQVIAVVADRPVMVLDLNVPLWRTLQPGTQGSDVELLQHALSDLGYDVVVDGEFGPITQNAVRQWYSERGFAPQEVAIEPGPTAPAPTPLLPTPAPSQDPGPVSPSADQPPDETETSGSAGAEDVAALAPTGLEAAQPPTPEMGVVVPLGEVVGIRGLPATVTRLPVAVGTETGGEPVAVLSPSDLVIRAPVESSRAELLTPGTSGVAEIDGAAGTWEVEVVAEGGGPTDTGSAPEESGLNGDDGMDSDMAGGAALPNVESGDVTFVPTVPIGSDLLGSSSRVEVTLESTEAPVLAAPIAAVRTNSDGEYVQVEDERGERIRVPITPGRSIGGWVELVNPGDALTPGTTVLLGR